MAGKIVGSQSDLGRVKKRLPLQGQLTSFAMESDALEVINILNGSLEDLLEVKNITDAIKSLKRE